MCLPTKTDLLFHLQLLFNVKVGCVWRCLLTAALLHDLHPFHALFIPISILSRTTRVCWSLGFTLYRSPVLQSLLFIIQWSQNAFFHFSLQVFSHNSVLTYFQYPDHKCNLTEQLEVWRHILLTGEFCICFLSISKCIYCQVVSFLSIKAYQQTSDRLSSAVVQFNKVMGLWWFTNQMGRLFPILSSTVAMTVKWLQLNHFITGTSSALLTLWCQTLFNKTAPTSSPQKKKKCLNERLCLASEKN